jgi:hypothetical protein
MEVTASQSPHLLVALDHLAEGSTIGCGQTQPIPGRNSGDYRRMVHRKQRQLLRRGSELGIQPLELLASELTGVFPRNRRVQRHEPQRAEIDRIPHRLAVTAGNSEVAMEGASVVMVAGKHVQRPEGRKELSHPFVFLVGRVIGDIACQEHRIGPWPKCAHRLGRCGEPGHGPVVEPVGTDVRIAQLREKKRPGHSDHHPSGWKEAAGPERKQRAAAYGDLSPHHRRLVHLCGRPRVPVIADL